MPGWNRDLKRNFEVMGNGRLFGAKLILITVELSWKTTCKRPLFQETKMIAFVLFISLRLQSLKNFQGEPVVCGQRGSAF